MNKISEAVKQATAAVSAGAQTLAFRGERKLRERMEAADTVEYVLMAAIFCLGIVTAAFALRGKITDIFVGIRETMEKAVADGTVTV